MNCKNLKQWQTRRTLSTIWIGLLISLNTGMAAPFNEVQFFDRVNSIYYTLDQTELQNFTAWLTSNVFINSTEGFFQRRGVSARIYLDVRKQDVFQPPPVAGTGRQCKRPAC